MTSGKGSGKPLIEHYLTRFPQHRIKVYTIKDLKPQSPQATVCCKVGAAALVHLRPVLGGCTILPFKTLTFFVQNRPAVIMSP